MNKITATLLGTGFAAYIFMATGSHLIADNTIVTDFGDGTPGDGWQADDVRNSSGTNITNSGTHAPASGATSDPTQVAAQIDWLNYFGSVGNLGGTRFDTSSSASQKSTLSLVDTSTGILTGSAMNDPSFYATYQWQNNDTVVAGLSLKFGVQSTQWGSGTGESQNSFNATRSGEGVWDLILVFDPTNNGQNSDVDGEVFTSTVTADSKFFLFPQASNGYWTTEYGAITAVGGDATIGINAGSRTLAEWAALDIDGSGSGTATWGDMLFDSGAIVSDVQFGMGSGNDGATTTLDWAQFSFINDGDVIDFVEASSWVGTTSGTQDFALSSNWSDSAGPSATQNVVFTDSATFTASVSDDTDARSVGVLNGNVTIDVADTKTLTLNNDGFLYTEQGATMNLTGAGTIDGAALESHGTTNIDLDMTMDGGSEDNPAYGGRYGIIVGNSGVINQNSSTVTIGSGAGLTFGTGSGIYNLNGGILEVGGTDGITGTGTLNFGGGTLRVVNSLLSTSVAPVFLDGTTSVVDTNSLSAVFSNGFTGTGAFDKTGDGDMELGGTSTLSSDSRVLSGNVVVGGANSSGGILTIDETGSLNVLSTSGFTRIRTGASGTGVLNLDGGSIELGLNGAIATFRIGDSGGNGTFNMSGGSVTSAQYSTGQYVAYVIGQGEGTVGLVEQTGGSVSFDDTAAFQIGILGGTGTYNLRNDAELILGGDGSTFYLAEGGGTATINLYDSSQYIQSVDTQSFIGEGGEGTINQIGTNTVVEFRGDTTGRAAWFGSAADGVGTYNLQDGELTFDTVAVRFGADADGEGYLNQSGGSLTATNASVSFGTNGYGEYNMSGGTASFENGFTIASGASSTGIVTQTGGTVTIGSGGKVIFGNGTGSYHLNDGTLEVGGTNGIQGSGDFNLGGGTLKVVNSDLTSSTDFTLTDATLSVLNTDTFNATLSGNMSTSTGVLIKTGTGELDLSTGTRTIGYLGVEEGSVEHVSGTTNLSRLTVGAEPQVLSVANGTFTLTDGVINMNTKYDGTENPDILVGSQGGAANTGVFNIDGGTLNLGTLGEAGIRSDFYIGAFGSEGTGTVNQTGGVVNKLGYYSVIGIGNQGTGTYNLSGGEMNLYGLYGMTLGRSGDWGVGTGTLNVSGGSLNIYGPGLQLGGAVATEPDTGSGTVNQTGGLVSLQNGSQLSIGFASPGTYNLNGGVLEVGGNNGIYQGVNSDANFNFGGGTLRVRDSNLTTSFDFALTSATTSVIDTNGFDATFSGDFDGASGVLVKTGTGELNFSSGTRNIFLLSVEEGSVEHISGISNLSRLSVGAEPLEAGVANGTFTLTNGTINLDVVNGSDLIVGSQDTGANTGVLNIDGGTINLGTAGESGNRSDVYIGGFGSTGSGTVNQSGGVINKLSDDGIIHIGNQAIGVYNLTGGEINISGDNGMVLGRSGNTWGEGNGTLNISGGTITFTEGTDLLLGGGQDTEPQSGSGTVNQTGGTISIQDGGNLIIGQRGTGTYNLNGGVLESGGDNRIKAGDGGTANFNMGGGTLRAISNLTMASGINPVLTSATTSTIDTNGYETTVNGAISGSGNLVVTGIGVLYLNGINTNTGTTAVNAGELSVQGSLAGSSLTIASGATLSGTGSISAATTVSGTLTPGNSPGVLTFSDGLTLDDTANVEIEFIADTTSGRGTNFDGIDVTGGTLSIDSAAILDLVFNGTGSSVDFTDTFWDSDQSWLLFDNAEAPTLDSMVFAAINASADSLGNIFNEYVGVFTVNALGNDLMLDFTAYVVPEPSTYALLMALGMGLLVLYRRRK